VKERKSPRKNRRATTPALKVYTSIVHGRHVAPQFGGLQKEGSAGGRDDVRQGCPIEQRSPGSRL
jgi:hypothetical protein